MELKLTKKQMLSAGIFLGVLFIAVPILSLLNQTNGNADEENREDLELFSAIESLSDEDFISVTNFLHRLTNGYYLSAEESTDAVSWEDAGDYIGSTQTVEGTIVASYNSGKACFLNFHPDYSTYFTAVIFASDFDNFPENPEDFYLGKTIQVTGEIEEYQGAPEIILESSAQISILD